MLLVEMSSCTRKMYGSGIEVQLRRKKVILAGLEERKRKGNTSQTLKNQINVAAKNVANYEQKYQNKINLYSIKKPNTSILGSVTSAIGNLVGPVKSASAANAQAVSNAANAAQVAQKSVESAVTPGAEPGAANNGVTPGEIKQAIVEVNHSKNLLKVAAQKASDLAKNLEKLANMTGGRRRTRRTRRRRN